MTSTPDMDCSYRCYGQMDQRGRWRAWRFAPGSNPGPAPGSDHGSYVGSSSNVAQYVHFVSVQSFAPPCEAKGVTWWRQVREQYTGESALPHDAPLYFDIDCDGDLDQALLWTRELVDFFTLELSVPQSAIRIWFSGSKGTHIFIDPAVFDIQPSTTLTTDMKVVALDLIKHLAAHGVPDMAIDANVYSLPRMLRLPDQINPKSGLYKIELSHHELMHFSSQQILALAKQPRGSLKTTHATPAQPVPAAVQWWTSTLSRVCQPREFRIQTAKIAGQKVRPDGYAIDELTSSAMPSCIRGILDAHVHPGDRNRCELQIACWAKAAKQPYPMALQLLAAWSQRNRAELSTDNAQRKAESIVRSVFDNAAYGFGCAPARAAAQCAGVDPDCDHCEIVEQRQQRQIYSLRVHHNDQWSPEQPITLEQSRGLITAAINNQIAPAPAPGSTPGSIPGSLAPGSFTLGFSGGTTGVTSGGSGGGTSGGGGGDGASGGGQDACGDSCVGATRHTGGVRHTHA